MSAKTDSLPPVYFNHLYLVLDDKTYRAVQGSDFLRSAFPGRERRATLTAAGESWSGTYFYCHDNYLEFFGSGNGPITGSATRGGHWQAGAQEGWAGLAFSIDQIGGAAAIREAVKNNLDYEPFSELRQLQAGDQPVNWFYNVKLAERLGLGSFESWVMEYHPDIFAYKDLPVLSPGELTRKAYLAPWNRERSPTLPAVPVAVKETIPGNKPAQDVPPHINTPRSTSSIHGASSSRGTNAPGSRPSGPEVNTPVFSRVIGATIHMDERRAERYAETLALFGYAQTGTPDGMRLSANGFDLFIQPEERGPAGYRLSSLRLAMSRPSVAPMTFVFAPRSRLELREDLTAEWVFGV